MAWFRSKEQKQKELEVFEVERLECLERKKQEEHYKEVLSQVIITPESLESYQRRMGYAVDVINTDIDGRNMSRWDGRPSEGITLQISRSEYIPSLDTTGPYAYLLEHLVESRIEALVEAENILDDDGFICVWFHGLPVAKRKSQGSPYR